MKNLLDLYQGVILDHNRNPRNLRPLANSTSSARAENPSCGDQYEVFVKMTAEQIEEITFWGSGCAISRASASVMTTEIQGLTIEEAKIKAENFLKAVESGETIEEWPLSMAAFAQVYKFPARIKCAKLAWTAALQAFKSSPEDSK